MLLLDLATGSNTRYTKMLITLHDLVTAKHSGPFFSPFCFPARLALMAKGLDFQTEEVTYHDLRFVWTPKLEVKRATGTRAGRSARVTGPPSR